MTEFDDIPVLVPEGKTFMDLTMGELDAASYQMKADVLECIAGQVPGKRYGAFVELAVQWARRTGATESRDVLVKRFRDYEPDQMFHALRKDDRTEEPPDPTVSTDVSSAYTSPESSGNSPTS